MQVYHNVQSHALFNINGHEQERNAMYDSLEGYKGDIRVNDYRRKLTEEEVKKILKQDQQQKKKRETRKRKRKKKRRKSKKRKRKPKVNT